MAHFDVERFMFYKGRRLYGFLIHAVSRLGVLASITGKFAELGLDITYFTTSAATAGREGSIVLFVDFTETELDPRVLAEELEGIEPVTDVALITPKVEGFIADTLSFPLKVGGIRAILFTEDALRGLLVDVRRSLGTGGEAMLYHFGVEVGREWASFVLEEAGKIGGIPRGDDSYSHRHLRLPRLWIDRGLEAERQPPYIHVKMSDNIECSLQRDAEHPFSHFIRGTLAGFASRLFNREMFAEEIRCMAKGDPHCEFEITPRT